MLTSGYIQMPLTEVIHISDWTLNRLQAGFSRQQVMYPVEISAAGESCITHTPDNNSRFFLIKNTYLSVYRTVSCFHTKTLPILNPRTTQKQTNIVCHHECQTTYIWHRFTLFPVGKHTCHCQFLKFSTNPTLIHHRFHMNKLRKKS